MSYRHAFTAIALREFKEAALWYGDQSADTASRFVAAVSDRVAAICGSPFLYRKTHRDLRETSVKKFPYSIVYYVDIRTETIIIIAVYHHSRDPKGKYRKGRHR